MVKSMTTFGVPDHVKPIRDQVLANAPDPQQGAYFGVPKVVE